MMNYLITLQLSSTRHRYEKLTINILYIIQITKFNDCSLERSEMKKIRELSVCFRESMAGENKILP